MHHKAIQTYIIIMDLTLQEYLDVNWQSQAVVSPKSNYHEGDRQTSRPLQECLTQSKPIPIQKINSYIRHECKPQQGPAVGYPIGMIVIVLMNLLMFNLMMCGNGALVRIVKCEPPHLNEIQMGLVNQINNKVNQIKNQVYAEFFLQLKILKTKMEEERKHERIIFEERMNNMTTIEVQKNVIMEKQIKDQINSIKNQINKGFEDVQNKFKNIDQLIEKNSTLLKEQLSKIKAQLQQTKLRLNSIEHLPKQRQLQIDLLKMGLQQHQSDIKNQLQKREHSMAEWKESTKKDLQSKVSAHHHQTNQKSVALEHHINGLKDNIDRHRNDVQNELNKRENAMHALKNQRDAAVQKSINNLKKDIQQHESTTKTELDKWENSITAWKVLTIKNLEDKIETNLNKGVQNNSHILSVLSLHSDILSQHQKMHSALSYYFSTPTNDSSTIFPHLSFNIVNFSNYGLSSNSLHSNVSILQSQFNKLDDVMYTFLRDYDHSTCKTSAYSFEKLYLQSLSGPLATKNRNLKLANTQLGHKWGIKQWILTFAIAAAIALLCCFLMRYMKPAVPKFGINQQCEAVRGYNLQQNNTKITCKSQHSDDVKQGKKNPSNMLYLKPTIRQMCTQLRQQHCSFSFTVGKSANLHISVGIAEQPARLNDNGEGTAVYLSGSSGRVFENGSEVECRYLSSFENPELRALGATHGKTAYLCEGNEGLKAQDVICTEVDIEKGSILWKVNGKTVAEYQSEEIKNKDMVPFISMVDLYDEASLLG